MRWADLDSLNHVNNVVYLDYAAESRAALVNDGLLSESAVIAGISVTYHRPLELGRLPVTVASSIDGATLMQQICIDAHGSRTVFAELVTRMGELEPAALHNDVVQLPMSLRRSDLDASGDVTPTKLFELFQEARVLSIATRLNALRPGSFVVGTSEVRLHRSICWRLEPCVAGMWISRVGRASFDIGVQLSDESGVLASARTVAVGFDPQTQRSRPFEERELAQLNQLLNESAM